VWAASFSPDGTRVVTAGDDGTARVWDVNVRLAGSFDRELIADAADALSGYFLDEHRGLLPLPDWFGRIRDVRKRVTGAPAQEHTVRSYLRWVLDDPWMRTISPYSTVTVDEFMKGCLGQGTSEARREAERTFPGHPLLAREKSKRDAAAAP
jgi:hypothetical protein